MLSDRHLCNQSIVSVLSVCCQSVASVLSETLFVRVFIDNIMKLINVNFYVSKYLPSKIIIIEHFNDVLISRCTHELPVFKSVRELGLQKTKIKVKNYYTF